MAISHVFGTLHVYTSNPSIMKRILFLVFIVFASTSIANAQYHPMLQTEHTWRGISYGWGVYDFFQNIGGDSLMGDVVWKKIYSGSTLSDMGYMVGLMREDVLNEKVYIWTGTEEHLIYDFDVEAGDIVSSWGVGMEQNITVTSVETVDVGGTSRKKINYNDQWSASYWIEGVGSMYGPIDGALGGIVDYYPLITCFYEDNNLAWDNPAEEGVCDSLLSIDEKQQGSLEIFPNPFNENLSFKINGLQFSGKITARIISMTGEIVLEVMLTPGLNQLSGLNTLSSGIYNLSIIQSGNTIVSGRIMKI